MPGAAVDRFGVASVEVERALVAVPGTGRCYSKRRAQPPWPVLLQDKFMLEAAQRRAISMVGGMESLSYKRRLKALGLFSPGKGRQSRDMITLHKYIKQVNTRYRKEPFKLKDCAGARTNRFKLANVGWKLGDGF